MRTLFLSLILLISFFAIPPANAARPLPAPKFLAVYFYADWCPNCKLLKAPMEKTQAEFAEADILFVTMDLTNKPTIHQSILHAQALGIGEFLKAQGSATGYVAILDAKTHKELKRFDRSTIDSLSSEIKTLLK